MIGPLENFRQNNRVAGGRGGAEEARYRIRRESFGRDLFAVGGGLCTALLEIAELVVEDLVKVGCQLVIRLIDLFAEVPCVLGDFLRAPQVLADAALDLVAPVGDLRVHDLRLDEGRALQGLRPRLQGRPGRRRTGLRATCGLRLGGTLLLGLLLSLGLGLRPHLGDAAEEIFDVVHAAESEGVGEW